MALSPLLQAKTEITLTPVPPPVEAALSWSQRTGKQALSAEEKRNALASSWDPLWEEDDSSVYPLEKQSRKKRPKRKGGSRRKKAKKASKKASKKRTSVKPKALPPAVIDLNKATLAQLVALPKVGPKTAQAILTYRAEHGDFLCFETLDDVPGIGKKSLERLKPWVKGASSQACSVTPTPSKEQDSF